jgi:hypothetical protein
MYAAVLLFDEPTSEHTLEQATSTEKYGKSGNHGSPYRGLATRPNG